MKPLLFYLVFLNFTGCAFQTNRSNQEGIQIDSQVSVYIEPEARGLFSEAELDAKNRKIGLATAKFDAIRKKWPQSKAAEIAFFRIANLSYSAGNYERASREFDAFLRRYPTSSFGFDVRYHLAASQYHLRRYAQAKETMRGLSRDQVLRQGSKRALTFFQLQALNAQAQGDNLGAVLAHSQQLSLTEEAESKKNDSREDRFFARRNQRR